MSQDLVEVHPYHLVYLEERKVDYPPPLYIREKVCL
jgi:hypothetical protein